MKPKLKKPIPFDFVLEQLTEADPITKPMFGCTAVYVKDKIVLVLRDKPDSYVEDNGVWIATTIEHHQSLKKDFPNMRSIKAFGTDITGWQVLPASAGDFEESVVKACEFILNHDPRIGKIPKSRARKSNRQLKPKKPTVKKKK